jgi:hypothetical protein
LRTVLGGNYLIFGLFYGQCTRATQPDGSRYRWKAYRLRVKRDHVTRETIRYSRAKLECTALSKLKRAVHGWPHP